MNDISNQTSQYAVFSFVMFDMGTWNPSRVFSDKKSTFGSVVISMALMAQDKVATMISDCISWSIYKAGKQQRREVTMTYERRISV